MANIPTPLPNPSQKHPAIPEMPADVQKQMQESVAFKILVKQGVDMQQAKKDAPALSAKLFKDWAK
jgi:hypothetical protein